jgi:hypothetical protein
MTRNDFAAIQLFGEDIWGRLGDEPVTGLVPTVLRPGALTLSSAWEKE